MRIWIKKKTIKLLFRIIVNCFCLNSHFSALFITSAVVIDFDCNTLSHKSIILPDGFFKNILFRIWIKIQVFVKGYIIILRIFYMGLWLGIWLRHFGNYLGVELFSFLEYPEIHNRTIRKISFLIVLESHWFEEFFPRWIL